jgi:hypothetical protein
VENCVCSIWENSFINPNNKSISRVVLFLRNVSKLKSTEHDGFSICLKGITAHFSNRCWLFYTERNTQNFKAASKRQISDYWLHNYTFRIIREKPQKIKFMNEKKVGFCLQLSSLRWSCCGAVESYENEIRSSVKESTSTVIYLKYSSDFLF